MAMLEVTRYRALGVPLRSGHPADPEDVPSVKLPAVPRIIGPQETGHVARFVVFGSFVTSKLDPQDVDVFLLMAGTFDAAQLRGGAQLLFDHAAAQAHFGASVFWVRRLAAWQGEQPAVEFWQIKRGGGRRGIVEITPEAI